MNPLIDKILSQVYELEGLLLVLDRHEGDTTSFVYDMIQKKVERINELAPHCVPGLFASQEVNFVSSQVEESKVEEQPTLVADAVQEEVQYDVNEYETANFEPEEDFRDEEELEIPEAISNDVEYSEESFDEPEEASNTEVDNMEEVVDEEPDVFIDDVEDEVLPEEEDEALKLDEVLQRNISKDLSKAFTLNDRFRYRRELFGNSEVEMCNTINMVEAMHSFSEAEDYFYGDLEWDKESPEVVDFMTIIKNHFL